MAKKMVAGTRKPCQTTKFVLENNINEKSSAFAELFSFVPGVGIEPTLQGTRV